MEAMPIVNKDEDDLRHQRTDQNDRLGFIRKVYGILSVQLCLTAGAITCVKTVPGWNEKM